LELFIHIYFRNYRTNDHTYQSSSQRDPIILGCHVECGIVRIGVKVCIPSKQNLVIGEITSIEKNNKEQESAKKGEDVAIRIENMSGQNYQVRKKTLEIFLRI
jgi:translation initiation factor IF-2